MSASWDGFSLKDESMKIDMFERLPTPFGLVRFGVAPDHPEATGNASAFSMAMI